MENKKSNWKIWRLTKVLYFIITLPLVLLWAWTILSSQETYNWGIWINDYYIWSLYMILFLISYILSTDFIRRVISYINNWNFNWFIDYNKILIIIKKYISYNINFKWKVWRLNFFIGFILINVIFWYIWKIIENFWDIISVSFLNIILFFYIILYLLIIINLIIKRLNDLNFKKWYLLLLLVPILNIMIIFSLLFNKWSISK